MRPVLIYLGGVFGVLLISIPAILLGSGANIAATVGSATLITLAATICYAIIRSMAAGYESDRERLLAGETLATWRLSPGEYRRFLEGERRRKRRLVVRFVLVGAVVGVTLGIVEDWLLGAVMFGSFLFAALLAHLLADPPRLADSEVGRDIWIGSRGVQVMGRYDPFHGTMTRIQKAEITPGDPAVLIMHVGTRSRVTDIRVPIPRDRVPEAEALANRLLN